MGCESLNIGRETLGIHLNSDSLGIGYDPIENKAIVVTDDRKKIEMRGII